MTIYSVDKLIAQARKLAADYRRATGKALSGISNEIAEYDAVRLLDLEACQDRSRGYDAVGRSGGLAGKRLQIKARAIFDEHKSGQRIGQLGVDRPWDAVLLVIMDDDYVVSEMYLAEREDLLEHLDKPSERQQKRGAMSVARFRIIGRRLWTREIGLEEEIWSNQSA